MSVSIKLAGTADCGEVNAMRTFKDLHRQIDKHREQQKLRNVSDIMGNVLIDLFFRPQWQRDGNWKWDWEKRQRKYPTLFFLSAVDGSLFRYAFPYSGPALPQINCTLHNLG